MLIHISPRFFMSYEREARVTLMELRIEPFGLNLQDGVDLATRRPYQNKSYSVGCRNRGLKAIDGIIVLTDASVNGFEYSAVWRIGKTHFVHCVSYQVLDHEFDAVSDDAALWKECGPGLGGWSSRIPEWAENIEPCHAIPKMELVAGEITLPGTVDLLEADSDLIMWRHQTFAMPSIEPERLLRSKLSDRYPTLDLAFETGVQAA